MLRVGVLAVQGAFREHLNSLGTIDHVMGVEVRTTHELESVDALILPGGESTAMIRIMTGSGLRNAIQKRIEGGMPVWGTCAGAILLSKKVDGNPGYIAALDVDIKRNGYGSQLDSFTAFKTVEVIHRDPFECIFIRAPYIEACGPEVAVLASHEEGIIAVRQGNILATTYHPELTQRNDYHRYFVEKLCQSY